MAVIPFKKGPDYIDAGWLAKAALSPCYNLDPFLIGGEGDVLKSFMERSENADISLIEGNRGLYDGMDVHGSLSTARIARILKAPVILIIDCTKTTRTAAAIVLGMKKFEPGVNIAGVVLNMIGRGRQEAVIRESIEKYCRVPVIGAIPRMKEAELPERHMGLTPWQEHSAMDGAIDAAEGLINKYVDIDRVIKIAKSAPLLPKAMKYKSDKIGTVGTPLKIGVIRDSAFQFYYPENIEELIKRGAGIIEISALRERELPDMDALYIGGGFPETHAASLSENASFMQSLKSAADSGLPIYAECGGLMYLADKLLMEDKTYKMSGVLSGAFKMHRRPQAHGYATAKVIAKNPFYKTGTVINGHEFHYSAPLPESINLKDNRMCLKVKRGAGIINNLDGMVKNNVFATYIHTHAIGTPQWAEGMLRAAGAHRKAKTS